MIIIIISCLFVLYVVYLINKNKCKHEQYFETRSCSAYCYSCNKNLGFISDLRKDKTKKEVWLGQPFDKTIQ